MSKLLGQILLILFVVGSVLLAAAPLMVLNGWVLSWLWLWFLVPLGVPAIGVVNAIGVAGVVSMLTKQYNHSGDADSKWEGLAYAVLSPLMALLIGYVVHLFM